LPGMALARGSLRILNLSTMIIFPSKSSSTRDRIGRARYRRAGAHAPKGNAGCEGTRD
jgi:hypothetical protein